VEWAAAVLLPGENLPVPLWTENWFALQVEVEIKFRPTVSRPVCHGVGHPCGNHDQISFLSDNCWFLDVGRPF
jgi:hypothetical protein